MNFIWEIVKKANMQSIKSEELFFCQSDQVSPWYEQSFTSLNQKEIDSKIIEINALCRFSGIFNNILHKELEGYEEYRKYIYDVFIHFLAELDLNSHLTRDDFYLSRLQNEIIDGVCGEKYGITIARMNFYDRKNLIDLLYHEMHTTATLTIFRNAIRMIYTDALLYQLKDKPNELILYVGMKKLKEEQKVNFIIDMFLPLGFDIRIFWENHFGVMSVDATMELDEIELF